ncbi:MAG: hypothetical protein LBN20_05460 [Endomicrobium sp.]|jgi:transketolase|nr:hypothetical protein [Endomicrobium sp.]
MQKEFLNAIYEIAQKDKNVLWLSADNGNDFDMFYYRDFPKQYFNMGIAEENMIGVAAGLASYGKNPFVYSAGTFLAYRTFEFIRDDICFQKKNVKVVGFGSGISISMLGPTHHSTEDIALLRTLPNLTILSPASPKEVYKCVHAAYEIKSPVYIRLEMSNEPEIYSGNCDFQLGKNNIICEGSDIAVFSTGSIISEVIIAAKKLKECGISVEIVNVHTIKPFDKNSVLKEAAKVKYIFVVEEHTIIGGLGGLIAEIIADENININFKRIGLNNCFAKGYGTISDVRKENGLNADSIFETIHNSLKEEK